jgi:hypothetical protein
LPVSPSSPVLQRARTTCVVRVAEPRGKLEIFLPKVGVLLTVVEGHLSHAMAKRWVEVIGPSFEKGLTFDTFHDWEAMTGYDSTARQELTSWVAASFRNVHSARFLAKDRLVRMGVSAASAIVSLAGVKIESFAERAPFERELGQYV